VKVATFTVRADARQSARWKIAAQVEGHPNVGSWLAGAADAYLKVRAKAGLPVPLAWRFGHFAARLEGGELQALKGWLSPPFGVFAGTAEGPASYAGKHRRHPSHFSGVQGAGFRAGAGMGTVGRGRGTAGETGGRRPPGLPVATHEGRFLRGRLYLSRSVTRLAGLLVLGRIRRGQHQTLPLLLDLLPLVRLASDEGHYNTA
jgi:hypothetical protein